MKKELIYLTVMILSLVIFASLIQMKKEMILFYQIEIKTFFKI